MFTDLEGPLLFAGRSFPSAAGTGSGTGNALRPATNPHACMAVTGQAGMTQASRILSQEPSGCPPRAPVLAARWLERRYQESWLTEK